MKRKLQKVLALLVDNECRGWCIKNYDTLCIEWHDPFTDRLEWLDDGHPMGHWYRCTTESQLALQLLKALKWETSLTLFMNEY